jgi:hypothetical protein
MMMKGRFRGLIPVKADLKVKIPLKTKVTGVQLLLGEQKPEYLIKNEYLTVSVQQILDH